MPSRLPNSWSDRALPVGRNRSNVWRYPGANSFARGGEEGNLLAMHPTVKPAAMVADAILDCSAYVGKVARDLEQNALAVLGAGDADRSALCCVDGRV
jgi:hypothetical protein